MTTTFAAFLGGWEIVLILAVVLILFGAKKLPELAKGLGQGIREFKKASNEVTRELQQAGEEDYSQRQKTIDASTSGQPGHWTEKYAGQENVTSAAQPVAPQPNQQKP